MIDEIITIFLIAIGGFFIWLAIPEIITHGLSLGNIGAIGIGTMAFIGAFFYIKNLIILRWFASPCQDEGGTD